MKVPVIPHRADGEGVGQRMVVVCETGSVVVVRVMVEMVEVFVTGPKRVVYV